MSLLSKGLRSIGITPSEVAQIATAYGTGGVGAAITTGFGALGGNESPARMPLPPFNPAGSDYARYMGQFGGTQQGQSVAVSQATQTAPQETGMSGEFMYGQGPMQAFAPIGAPLSQLARRFLPDIIGGGLIGGGVAAAPLIMDAVTGKPKKLRVTRKLKRIVREAVDNFGVQGAMEMSGLDRDTIMYIYTKKMRNDGAYVTKAAVRKTRSTVRKMKTLCDMYDDLRPAAKRRAPARRMAAGTRITQVK